MTPEDHLNRAVETEFNFVCDVLAKTPPSEMPVQLAIEEGVAFAVTDRFRALGWAVDFELNDWANGSTRFRFGYPENA